MFIIRPEYYSIGGNRHPSAADWDPVSEILAYGAYANIALWSPLASSHKGVTALLQGHTGYVNAVKFFPTAADQPRIILSGSVDKTIRLWRAQRGDCVKYEQLGRLESHAQSVNCISASKETNVFVTGSADATIKVWRLNVRENLLSADLIQTIQTNPRFLPLTLVVHSLHNAEDLVLFAAGTRALVQVFVASEKQPFLQQATLTGHEGWIRSLTISPESSSIGSDLILASASQDKYIRLWRMRRTKNLSEAASNRSLAALENSLSNRAQRIEASNILYSLTFEALLLGHEDWIYTVSWRLDDKRLQLLSASADSSLAIWESEESSGVWVCTTRLGEISAQKGSTTATGSSGSFWIGIWSPHGESLASLSRTGSWRIWSFDKGQNRWVQGVGISGHTKAIVDIAWASDGSSMLSTSLDQTTRLHAEWRQSSSRSWHEMARPQIHGYDCNCISSISPTRFIAGADEKLLRVFDQPRISADILNRLCGIQLPSTAALPEAANIPVLGLSNKALQTDDEGNPDESHTIDDQAGSMVSTGSSQLGDSHCPPTEDQLARHTLWPEREKLYGHGFEISAVATSHDGSLVATACKASSLDHAVIRLYTTIDWREVKPSLRAHTLTVTALCFSDDDKYLLSVGRDRQWALFARDMTTLNVYLPKCLNSKGHSRMILNACWAPLYAGRVFATAGRDKIVKIWKLDDTSAECIATLPTASPVTAIDIAPHDRQDDLMIAIGTEAGDVFVKVLQLRDLRVTRVIELDRSLRPSRSVTALAYRPRLASMRTDDGYSDEQGILQLAVASEDTSLRLLSLVNLFQEGPS